MWDWSRLARSWFQWAGYYEQKTSGFIKCGKFLYKPSRNLFHVVSMYRCTACLGKVVPPSGEKKNGTLSNRGTNYEFLEQRAIFCSKS
jgi:hypothetical protein